MNHSLTMIFTPFLIVLCLSCGRQQKTLEPLNLYGGKERSNNFSYNGTFTSELTFSLTAQRSKTNKKALPGASSVALPITFSTVYIPTIDGFVACVTDKTVEWLAPLDNAAIIRSASVTDAQDNFYGLANDGTLYSIARDGKRRWKTPVFLPKTDTKYRDPTEYLDLLALSDGVIVASSSGSICKVRYDGSLAWRHSAGLILTQTLSADEREELVFLAAHNPSGAGDTLIALSAADGSRRWAAVAAQTRIFTTPATLNGLIAVAAKYSDTDRIRTVLKTWNMQGKELWTAETPTIVPLGVAIDTDTSVVVSGFASALFGGDAVSRVLTFSAQGKELWRLGFENQIISAPMISKKNIVVLASKGAALGAYYIDKNGVFSKVFSLSDMPEALLQPTVDYDCNLVFATSRELGIFRLGRSPVQKLLP